MADEKAKRFLLSAADAKRDEKLLELFEALKGRPATDQEKQELVAVPAPAPEDSDRERWLKAVTDRNGQEWVERHKALLDDQWKFIQGL